MKLTLDAATGFYVLPIPPGAPVVHVSPAGSDGNAGGPNDPVATIAGARKKIPKGKASAMLLQAGARFVDQQLWVDGGENNDAPQVVATYGGTDRAVIDTSSPAPGESALQVRGPAFVSDIEFVCEPGRSGCVVRGKFDLVAQNVLVRDAGMGWDLSETNATLHRCLVLDCYDPRGDKSQGTYLTKGLFTAFQSVWLRCGWKPGVPLTVFSSDKNHCIYIDEDCPGPATLEECFLGEACSHGTQFRTGGTVRRSVYWRCPIGGFAQGPVGVIEDSYFEQQDATQLGQGTAPGAEQRGWGWDLEATRAEMHRCAFYRGGGKSPTARAVELSRVDPKRSPPRTGPGIFVTATRVAAWAGGVKTTAPAAELGPIDFEIDGPSPRWPQYTVNPYVESLRALRRGSDWGLIARLAADGYAALEQVLPAAQVRAVTSASAKSIRDCAATLQATAAALEQV